MRFVHLVHHFWGADVSMKCDRIAVFAKTFVVEFADRPPPQVVVVIENTYLCGHNSLLKRWAQVVSKASESNRRASIHRPSSIPEGSTARRTETGLDSPCAPGAAWAGHTIHRERW